MTRDAAHAWLDRYWTDATRSTIERVFHNVFLIAFDEAERRSVFTESYIERPT